MNPISLQELNDAIAPSGEFSGIIFDCDGTLADTMPNHFAAWTAALSSHGAVFSEDLFYSLGGMPTDDIVRFLNRKFGYTLDIADTHANKEKLYTDLLYQVQEITDVANVARAYKGTVPLAVASGGRRSVVEATLKTVGLTELFDVIVTADDVQNGKPAPDIFLFAAERMGVSPAECIVYEDGDPGIVAAKAAGMRVVDVRVLKMSVGTQSK